MTATNQTTMGTLNVFGVEVTLLSERECKTSGHVLATLTCKPGMGAPLHRHEEREAFYVTNGELWIEVDGKERILRRGDFVQVESWQIHRFMNKGSLLAELVYISLPSGHGKFFREADALFTSGGFTPEAAILVSEANGIEIIREA